jgi:hypothetical protein
MSFEVAPSAINSHSCSCVRWCAVACAQLYLFVITWEWVLMAYYGVLVFAPADRLFRRPALRGYAVRAPYEFMYLDFALLF